jgi:hypothetical protein
LAKTSKSTPFYVLEYGLSDKKLTVIEIKKKYKNIKKEQKKQVKTKN